MKKNLLVSTLSLLLVSTFTLVLKSQIPQVSPEIVTQLYQVMYDTDQIFRYHNVTYWANAGTLLGLVRHQGIIPWDDDLDIDMPKEQEPLLLALEPLFKKLGYTLINTFFGYKILCNSPQDYPFLDIFTVQEENNMIFYANKSIAAGWGYRDGKPRYFTHEEVYPLIEKQFGSFNIFCPTNPSPWLESAYGKGFMHYAKFDGTHASAHRRIFRLLTDQEKRPAQPSNKTVTRTNETFLSTALWKDELRFIKHLTENKPNIFEWATGKSSSILASETSNYKAVIALSSWQQQDPSSVPNIQYDTQPLDGTSAAYDAYIQAIEKYNTRYNLILIRGVKKVDCALISSKYIENNGLVIIDGFNFLSSEEQTTVLQHYNLIETFCTLGILKKKLQ